MFRYGFIYGAYKDDAWYWEQVISLHKFLLTSVIIFVKPGTVAQLAAAFVINLAFLVLHVQTQAFKTIVENTAQLNGLVSILLTLFSGILLKYDALADESADPYNKYTILVVLMGSQLAVAAMFVSGVAFNKKRKKPIDLLKDHVVDAAKTAALDKLREQSSTALDELDETINEMVERAQIREEAAELFGTLVMTCRSMDPVSGPEALQFCAALNTSCRAKCSCIFDRRLSLCCRKRCRSCVRASL